MDVLATFIRDHSSEPWPPVEEAGRVLHQERATRPDIQAALTVIGRRDPRHDRRWSGRVDLHSAVLGRADLRSADLGSADLSGAVLVGANLSGAYLSGANLEGAYLNGAFLTDANLEGAQLRGAQLRGAHLSGAYLNGAFLTGADLTDVQGWPEKEIPVPHGWIFDKDSDRLLKRAGELSEVTAHYL
jgi:Pentapeptide repeats (8 copies)